MKNVLRRGSIAFAAVLLPAVVLAQFGPRGGFNGPGGPAGFGGPPGPGGFGPGGPGAPMMPGPGGFAPGGPGAAPAAGPGGTSIADASSLQSQLRSSDEEWKVIGPKIDAVIAAQNSANPNPGDQGGAFGFGGRDLPQSSDTFSGPEAVPAGGNFRAGPGAFGPIGSVIGSIFAGTPGTPPPAVKPSTEPATDPSAPDSAANSGTTLRSITYAQALADLQSALRDKSTTARQLGDLLITVRAARQKARDDLVAAENDLSALLTPDQEALLVSLGYMD